MSSDELGLDFPLINLKKDHPPIFVSKRKYGGKFIAILNNKIIASGRTHFQARHNVRKKVKPKERKSVEYYFIERKSNLIRSIILGLISFLLLNLLLSEKMLLNDNLPDFVGVLLGRLTILIFFDITIITSFIALTTLIDPIFRSHVALGVIGESIKRQEHQVGWEIALTTTTAYMLLVSVIGQLWIAVEYNLSFEMSYISGILIFLFLLHLLFVIIEDRRLKFLHNYLIDTITFNDRLTYEEIADYLKDIPELRKSNPDQKILLETIEASIESPFSFRNVIVFRIFIRDLTIMIGSIIVPFIGTHLIISDTFLARIWGGLIASVIILIYGGIKQNSSDQWAPKFLSTHPTLTLRPGGVDRVYIKFFPDQVQTLKQDTVLTILTQSVSFSRGIGIALLSYSSFSFFIILLQDLREFRVILESFWIILVVFITAVYTVRIARQGTITWVKSVEKNILDMDERLKISLGFTPIEISAYLKEARSARDNMLNEKR